MCRWHRHTTGNERRLLLTAKFFKRQVLDSSSLLHSLLSDRRDNDEPEDCETKPFYSIRARTCKQISRSFFRTVLSQTINQSINQSKRIYKAPYVASESRRNNYRYTSSSSCSFIKKLSKCNLYMQRD